MVSYCTTCMDRLHHLSLTLPANLEATQGENCEFILLDYGSKQDIAGWVSLHLQEHLESGRLKLYRTREPNYWSATHAKNISHKLGRGEILCNTDADIYLPWGFTGYINEKMGWNTIIQFPGEDIYGNAGTAGMVVVRREHFLAVRGYEETLTGWTADDTHFRMRATLACRLQLIEGDSICTTIPHGNDERLARCKGQSLGNNFRADQIYESIRNDLYVRMQTGDFLANATGPWGAVGDLEQFRPGLGWRQIAEGGTRILKNKA